MVWIAAVEQAVALADEAHQIECGKVCLASENPVLWDAPHGMPHFVQERGDALCPRRELGADADEAIDHVDEDSETRANAGADPEPRLVVEAVGGQVGGVEEAGLSEGQQVLPQLRICQEKSVVQVF